MKIVLDFLIEFDKSIFTYQGTKKYIGVSWIPLLSQMAKEAGIEVVLAADYLEEKVFSPTDLLISEGITPRTKALLSTSATPFLLFSGESPNVDWKLYTFLKKYSKLYKHSFFFEGSRKYVHQKSSFQPFFWPNDQTRAVLNAVVPIAKRKMLVMIAGNKKQSGNSNDGILKRTLKGGVMKIITGITPSMKLKDLYKTRMQAICFFAARGSFDLYGRHWENSRSLSQAEQKAIRLLKPKPVEDKFKVLSGYKFALCFENCIYPGYVTEKIFDCFLAGCIPIYLGAPNIEEYIPTDLFIDMRSFHDFEMLASHLESLSEDACIGYLERTLAYLKSIDFEKFTDQSFVQQILVQVSNEGETNLKKRSSDDVESTKII